MSDPNKAVTSQEFPQALNTQRVMLRPYRPEDATEILELAQRNRERLIREFAQVAALTNLGDAQTFIAEKTDSWNSRRSFCYGIWHGAPNKLIGQIQVKNIAWEIPSAELGYFVDASMQRQGYAGEVIREILKLAFRQLGFQRIFVRILPSNAQSLSLSRKLGFREEGLHRRAFRCGFGELHDVQYLSIIADDFLAVRGSV